VVIGHEHFPLIPGIIREGQDRDDFKFTEEEALRSAKASFDVYATDKSSISVLYWRWPPELKQRGKRWIVYMRCLISERGKKQDAA
jgi:hypothetical protein